METTELATFDKEFATGAQSWRGLFNDEKDYKEYCTMVKVVCIDEGLKRDNASPVYMRSLWKAFRMIAALKLRPGKQYGHFDLHVEKINKEDQVVCRPMYQGLLDLIYRDPNVVFAKGEVVREGETFIDNGICAAPTHQKNLEGKGKIIASYAVVKYKDGIVREILTTDDLNRIKRHITDRAYAHYINGVKQEPELKGIAVTWEDQWAMIKALRRVMKSLRRSFTIEEQTVMNELDNKDYNLEGK